MKSTFLSLSMLATAVFLSAAGNVALAQKKVKDKVLAGKIYTVEMAETTGKKVGKKDNDEISFKSEKLNSKFITTSVHFPAAPYIVTVDSTSTPPDITFTSEGKNTEGEDIKWEGVITGDDIEGTAVVSKKGKVKREFSYTGTLKVKGKKKPE